MQLENWEAIKRLARESGERYFLFTEVLSSMRKTGDDYGDNSSVIKME